MNYVFDAIDLIKPKYVIIENVPMLLKFKLPYNGELHTVVEILSSKSVTIASSIDFVNA